MLTFEKLFLVAPMIPMVVVILTLISLSLGYSSLKKQLNSALEDIAGLKKGLDDHKQMSTYLNMKTYETVMKEIQKAKPKQRSAKPKSKNTGSKNDRRTKAKNS